MKQSFGEITNRHIFQQGLRDLIKEELHKHDELENLYVEWEKGMAVAYKGSVCVTGVDEQLIFVNIMLYDELALANPRNFMEEACKTVDHRRVIAIKQHDYIKSKNSEKYSLAVLHTEYFDLKQTLRNFLLEKRQQKQLLPVQLQFKIVIQILDAIAAFHSKQIAIGTLLPEYFTYDLSLDFKLAYFDVFRLNSQFNQNLETIYFKSPEQRMLDQEAQNISDNIFNPNKSISDISSNSQAKYFTIGSDLYQFGLIMLDVIAANKFNPQQRINNLCAIQNFEQLSYSQYSSTEEFLFNKAKQCLHPNPEIRGTAAMHLRDLAEEEQKYISNYSQKSQIYSLKLKLLPNKQNFEPKWFDFIVNYIESQVQYKEFIAIENDEFSIKFKGIESKPSSNSNDQNINNSPIMKDSNSCMAFSDSQPFYKERMLTMHNILSLNKHQTEFLNNYFKALKTVPAHQRVQSTFSVQFQRYKSTDNFNCSMIATFETTSEYTSNVKKLVSEYSLKGISIPRQLIFKIVLSILDAICSLETANVSVLDISSSNVLLKGQGEVKLGLGGITSLMLAYDRQRQLSETVPITPCVAPEVHRCFYGFWQSKTNIMTDLSFSQYQQIGTGSDLYSLGVIILELMFARQGQKKPITEIMSNIYTGSQEWSNHPDADKYLYEAALKMLSANSQDRGKALDHLLSIGKEEKLRFATQPTPIYQQSLQQSLDVLTVNSIEEVNKNFFRYKKMAVNLGKPPFNAQKDSQELFDLLGHQGGIEALYLTQDYYICPYGNKCYEKNKVSAQIISDILPVLRNNQLTDLTLEINDSFVSLEFFKPFLVLLTKQNLIQLSLGLESNQIFSSDPQNAVMFSEMFRHFNLTSLTLNISNNRLTEENSLIIFSSLQQLSELTSLSLNLKLNSIGDNGALNLFFVLSKLRNLTALNLNLSDNRLCEKSLANSSTCFEALTLLQTLTMNISNNGIGQKGVHFFFGSFAPLINLQDLTLIFNNCNIKERVFKTIKKVFDSQVTSLTNLSISFRSNPIGDSGCSFLQNAIISLQYLRKLSIDIGNIQNEEEGLKMVFQTLAALRKLTFLSLNVESNQISDDEFVDYASAFIKMDSLKETYLFLRDNPISYGKINILKSYFDKKAIKHNL